MGSRACWRLKASPGAGAKKPPETAPANRFKAKGRHFHFCPAKNVVFSATDWLRQAEHMERLAVDFRAETSYSESLSHISGLPPVAGAKRKEHRETHRPRAYFNEEEDA